MGDITANFSKSEFACKCGCGFNNINIGIVNRLQVLRDIVGEPLLIQSGCRCMRHNDKVKGAKGSLHLVGLAVDFTIPSAFGKLSKLNAMFEERWSGGWKYYARKKFIHCDKGIKRRW